MKKLLLFILIIGFAPFYFSQSHSIKEQKIRELLTLIRDNGKYEQVLKGMTDAICKAYPEINKEQYSEIVSQIDLNEIDELFIPAYDKYYTVEDIDQMKVFYKSPVGQKILSVMPQISQEVVASLLQWSRGKMERVLRKMKSED